MPLNTAWCTEHWRPCDPAFSRLHSMSASCCRYCSICFKLRGTAACSSTHHTPTLKPERHAHTHTTHTHRCRHIDTHNRSNADCNQAYQRRGCSLDCFSQLGNSQCTNSIFYCPLIKICCANKAYNQAKWQMEEYFPVQGNLVRLDAKALRTLLWKRTAARLPKRAVLNPSTTGCHVFLMPGVTVGHSLACLSARAMSVLDMSLRR